MNQDLYCSSRQDHGLDKALDQQLIVMSREALDSGTPVRFSTTIANTNRTVGTMLGHELTKAYGGQGLPDGTIDITFDGSAGNSFGAFVPRGITLRVYGDANDYVGKGLSGGRLVVRPSDDAPEDYVAEDNIIGGQRDPVRCDQRPGVPARRRRRAVRGAQLRRARGGRGRRRSRLRVHDRRQGRHPRARPAVTSRRVCPAGWPTFTTPNGTLRGATSTPRWWTSTTSTTTTSTGCTTCSIAHVDATDSAVGQRILTDWSGQVEHFVKVMPRDYKRVLQAIAAGRGSRRGRRQGDHGGGTVADPSGFLKYTKRETPPRRPVPAAAAATGKRSTRTSPTIPCASRPRAAWTAVFRSATTAARWAT